MNNLKMKKIIVSIVIGLLFFIGKAQNKSDRVFFYNINTKEYSVKIDKQTIKKNSINLDYPALALNLRKNNFFKISKTAKENFSEEDLVLDAVLWIEPGDPEICKISLGENKGKRALLKVVFENWNFDFLKNINQLIFEDDGIEKKYIKAKTIFLVKASDDLFFKVRIDKFDKLKEELILTYKKL